MYQNVEMSFPLESFNPITTYIPHHIKPVDWKAMQINWLVSIWWRTLVVNGLNNSGCLNMTLTVQKMKFSIKDFFSKCDQIRRKLRIWSHWLKKSLMKNFIFFAKCLGSRILSSMSLTDFFLTLSVLPNESINTFVLKDHIFFSRKYDSIDVFLELCCMGQNMGHKLTFFIWVSVSLFLTYDVKVFKKWIYFE